MEYKIIDASPIKLSHFELKIEDLLVALKNTNKQFEKMYLKTKEMHLDVFSVLDFRVLSGMIGEAFVTELTKINQNLIKNPNLDGYPDLLQVSTPEMKQYYQNCVSGDFILFKYGGLEVKNTFGTKKGGAFLLKGDQRIKLINKKMDWKAHHRETNSLIALFTDYIQGVPKIVALFYSDTLCSDDWTAKQNPKEGSAMTSFSCIGPTGFKKLKSGLKICVDDKEYLNFTKSTEICQLF